MNRTWILIALGLTGCAGDLPPAPTDLFSTSYAVTVSGGELDASFESTGVRSTYSGPDCLASERLATGIDEVVGTYFPFSTNGVRTDGISPLLRLPEGDVFGSAAVVEQSDERLALRIQAEQLCTDGVCEPYDEVFEIEVDGPVDEVTHTGVPNEDFVDPVTGEALCHAYPSP